MVDKLKIYQVFPTTAPQPDELARVLAALEGEPVAFPTHASTDERKRIPYDRDALLRSFASARSGYHLWRAKVPKYNEAFVSAKATTHNLVKVDYDSAPRDSQLPELFAAWTRVASVLKPEFGFVHSLWALGKPSEEYNRGPGITAQKLRDFGFRSVHARTWFGPDLVAVIGVERLLRIEHTTRTSWGGVQLDLVPNPWAATFEQLEGRTREVKQIFASWGLLGDYSDLNNTRPGPNWTPRLWKV